MSEINRVQRERAITVYANVKGDQSQQLALQAAKDVGLRVLPVGHHVELSGSAQTFGDSFKSLAIALTLGLFVAAMVLASQFNSFLEPLTVLAALPFSVAGAFVALLMAHQTINIYRVLGLILLMGIVKKKFDLARRF